MEDKRRNAHLHLAHSYWKKQPQKQTWAIDATCGNGHDTKVLAEIFAGVIAIDIQKEALEKTKLRLGTLPHLHYFHQSHASFPPLALEKPISLIVYNLGYLPGGDKTNTTQTPTTLSSLQDALLLLIPGGLISVTCYPGHPEGAQEEEALIELAKELDPSIWQVCHHRWINKKRGPSLLLLEKISDH